VAAEILDTGLLGGLCCSDGSGGGGIAGGGLPLEERAGGRMAAAIIASAAALGLLQVKDFLATPRRGFIITVFGSFYKDFC
jgi:hypothetical protein